MKSASNTNPIQVLVPGKRSHSYRGKATIRRLNLYSQKPDKMARRIRPDRRWYGNTRTISHSELDMCRQEVREVFNDQETVTQAHDPDT